VTQAVTSALAGETRTIPIVFAVVSDPIGGGFAASLAHPRGNITGFTYMDPEVGLGGDPFGARVAASASLRATALAGVGQGRTTVEAGQCRRREGP
jgi:hypothetical protein